MDFGHFSFSLSSKINKFRYLLMFVKLLSEWQTMSYGVLSGSTLFAQAYLSEYVEYVR